MKVAGSNEANFGFGNYLTVVKNTDFEIFV
jgi:hypothetical protein